MKKFWLKTIESDRMNQLNQFTLKLNGSGYPLKYGLTAQQTTEARNDYLWLNFAVICALQFLQESKNRSQWKNTLANGPAGSVPSNVPSVGSEFVAPSVPVPVDGIIPRFRALVSYLKNHPNYDVADGIDLGIESTEQSAAPNKPVASVRTTGPTTVVGTVKKAGHRGYIAWCKRGNETTPTNLGTFNRARFTDDRPNLVTGVPECREYTFQYVDDDAPNGELSDVYKIVTSGIVAA